MIEHLHFYEGKCLAQGASEQLVCLARLRGPRGVIVRKDDRSSVCRECRLNYFTRIDACLAKGAAKHLLDSDDPMLCVKPYRGKDFVLATGESKLQVVTDSARRRKSATE